jgi:hypothetical protein
VNSLPCPCGRSAYFKRCKAKNVLSSVGHIAVPRRYDACRHCRAKRTPWEAWAGVTGTHRVTPHARRMIVLAGSGCSFDEAQRNLRELCHLPVSNDVVRRVCDEEGKAVRTWMSEAPQVKAAFDAAEGAVEFSTDGLMVNTTGGWREIRQSVIAKREPATPAAPDQWDKRVLEAPAVRVAVCAIARCDLVGAGWRRLVGQLGLPPGLEVSVIADGAKWIWDQAAERFGGRPTQWVVDVYHVMLYLFAAAAALGKGRAEAWAGERVVELIEMGGPRFIEHLNATGPPQVPPDASAATAEAWSKLLGYLTDNRDSLWYGKRLKEGLPIGSGLIEGGGKTTLARRLKINSARWRIRRAERMGAIRCLQYSGLWEAYWDSKTAAAEAG